MSIEDDLLDQELIIITREPIPFTTIMNSDMDRLPTPLTIAIALYMTRDDRNFSIDDLMKKWNIGLEQWDDAIRTLKDLGIIVQVI